MRETYSEAMKQVFADEGGYTNEATDPGGPTNWGITIHDARAYWKADATAADVRSMPRSVAEEIYRKHYADAVGYDKLPPGVDYAVLDYGINSGVSRSLRVYNAVKTSDPITTINHIYDERLNFLQSLTNWRVYGRGWGARCARGRKLAFDLCKKYSDAHAASQAATTVKNTSAGAILVGGAATAVTQPHLWPWIIGATVIAAAVVWLAIHYANKPKELQNV